VGASFPLGDLIRSLGGRGFELRDSLEKLGWRSGFIGRGREVRFPSTLLAGLAPIVRWSSVDVESLGVLGRSVGATLCFDFVGRW
jgi:hypothetical protein